MYPGAPVYPVATARVPANEMGFSITENYVYQIAAARDQDLENS